MIALTVPPGQVVINTLDLVVCETTVNLSIICRGSASATVPVLFFHGFGSTKEDFFDLVFYPPFDNRTLIAYDAPGCGETVCGDLSLTSIAFLVETAEALLDALNITRFHLVGHSMGALTALMLADKHKDRVLSFINIKGNLAPEDCFLSRQIYDYPSDRAAAFFEKFIERAARAPARSSALYAASLRHKVRPDAVAGIFKSMVHLSDHGHLLDRFLDLPCPKMFMFGEEYAMLSYLPQLSARGVELAEIPYSGTFQCIRTHQRRGGVSANF